MDNAQDASGGGEAGATGGVPRASPAASLPAAVESLRERIAALRQALSKRVGQPLILVTDTSRPVVDFLGREDAGQLLQRHTALPVKELEQEVWASDWVTLGSDLPVPDAGPAHAMFDRALGMISVGRTARSAADVAYAFREAIGTILAVEGAGGDRQATGRAAGTGLDRPEPGPGAAHVDQGQMFAGEVALVTGAASGIGKACIDAFLRRGAAVVGLDINPDIVGLHDGPEYLGLCGDLTDEDAVCTAMEYAVRAFGGLDMLVPNAGVFPKGCPIASLSTAEWRRVMAINLDANLVLFREAYPLLRRAPRKGRVVVMSSRNVPAPGPGAVAYSASKAALTQLARVAALEWGSDGIRVNVLNPHAVFDTGIWTDEVLNARAAHYGLTVEQYKRNNVLKVEIESRDVAELVAEMCGPLFSKTTGAQIPIDGGSDRVI